MDTVQLQVVFGGNNKCTLSIQCHSFVAELPKSGYNLPRQGIPPAVGAQRLSSSNSLSTFSPSKIVSEICT